MSSANYQYAFTLHGHSADVRNLCVPTPSLPLLLSGSRDGSAIMWGVSDKGGSSGGEWDAKFRVEGPEKRFTSCTGMVRVGGEAYLVIGSSNGVMSAFALPSGTTPPLRDGEMPEPARTLIEHKQNLCCMDTTTKGLIASGSWDKTVIVWKDFKPAVRIEEHEQAIWSVKFVGDDRILTASADNKIKLHSFDCASGKSTVLQEYSGHTQPVRGLSLRPDNTGFWSCGNDSLVNVYSFERPAPLRSLSGHTSFVYGVVALPEGGAISSGEDASLRVWSETGLLQTIPHPATSIWSCAMVAAPSGGSYIASSANDGMIRFFTRNPELAAAGVTREQWEQSIKERQLDKSQVGDVKHSDLPGMEALGREGKKEGQVMMIKNNDKVEAYQWSSAERTWQQVGQVVDAVGSGRKQLFQGEEYDYVFDVDVAEGVPPLKLPYNVSGLENPWVAAQRFLERNDLPSSYSEQVVEFIHKNTGGASLGSQDTGSTYVDPYTGAGRYTGASAGASGSGAGQSSDPFTGSGAYSSRPTAPTPKPKGILPVKSPLFFKQINVTAAKGKIAQLNEELKTADAGAAFSPEQESNLAQIYDVLGGASTGATYDAEAFLTCIAKWPEAKRFPLLDLARALCTTSTAIGSVPGIGTRLLQLCSFSANPAPVSEKTKDTNVMLALRALANLFATQSGRSSMAASGSDILTALSARPWAEIGKGRQTAATIALNYSVMAVTGELPADMATGLLQLTTLILKSEQDDSEAAYRAAVALGNIISAPSASGSLQVGNLQEAKAVASASAQKFNEKRLLDLVAEIESLGA